MTERHGVKKWIRSGWLWAVVFTIVVILATTAAALYAANDDPALGTPKEFLGNVEVKADLRTWDSDGDGSADYVRIGTELVPVTEPNKGWRTLEVLDIGTTVFVVGAGAIFAANKAQ